MNEAFRPAILQDMNAVMAIVSGTVALMAAEGSDQWGRDYPRPEHFVPDIEARSLTLCERAGRVVGFICVNGEQPPEYAAITWGCTGPCLVIHRLAVAPGARRTGVGGALLAFAEDLASRRGIHHLRSDTYSINQGMNALFVGSGYRKVGEVNLKHRPLPYYCYEKLWEPHPCHVAEEERI